MHNWEWEVVNKELHNLHVPTARAYMRAREMRAYARCAYASVDAFYRAAPTSCAQRYLPAEGVIGADGAGVRGGRAW